MINIKTILWNTKEKKPGVLPDFDFFNPDNQRETSDLFLFWGSYTELINTQLHTELQARYPQAIILGCSTPGGISGQQLYEEGILISKIQFEHTELKQVNSTLQNSDDIWQIGSGLAQSLNAPNLQYVLIIIANHEINHCQLLEGLNSGLHEKVIISGGLAGFGEDPPILFNNDGVHHETVSAIGFYGSSLHVSSGAAGGWDPFGPERIITRSKNNVIYEMDHQPALDLYMRYLGVHALSLPVSSLNFPLELETSSGEQVVRAVLSISEKERNLTFGGSMPEGSRVRLMKYNPNRLIDGAGKAASFSLKDFIGPPQMALLISCIGRKLVLRQRIEEELEEVQRNLGENIPLSGFYSGGEIATLTPGLPCQLHNETMSVTLFYEE